MAKASMSGVYFLVRILDPWWFDDSRKNGKKQIVLSVQKMTVAEGQAIGTDRTRTLDETSINSPFKSAKDGGFHLIKLASSYLFTWLPQREKKNLLAMFLWVHAPLIAIIDISTAFTAFQESYIFFFSFWMASKGNKSHLIAHTIFVRYPMCLLAGPSAIRKPETKRSLIIFRFAHLIWMRGTIVRRIGMHSSGSQNWFWSQRRVWSMEGTLKTSLMWPRL